MQIPVEMYFRSISGIKKKACERRNLMIFAKYRVQLFFTEKYLYLLRKSTKGDGNSNLKQPTFHENFIPEINF